MRSRFTRAAAVAGAVSLLAALPAGAVDETKPTLDGPCTTSLFTDARGDQAGLIGPAPESTDIVAGFFSYDPEGNLVGNLQVANLTKDVPAEYSGISWLINFQRGGTEYYVQASTNGADVTFTHGTRDGSQLNEAGTTSGKLFEGADGVVQLVIPESIAPEGEQLTAVYGRATVDAFVVLFSADDAPDSGSESTLTHTPKRCAAPATPATPGAPSAGATSLDVKVSPSSISAAKSKRGVKLTLTSAKTLTKVRLTLRKGKKAVATGSIASLSGKKAVTLKRKAKLTPGSYTLSVVAAEGKRDFKVKVRK